MARRRETVEAALGALEEAGIKGAVEQTNGKHFRISWEWNGVGRSVVVSSTPRCSHAAMNARGDVRRILRGDGAIIS
jgi:hypothetical protein